VKGVINAHLNSISQLAGFARVDDLRYFLQAIGKTGYEHRPELAPVMGMLEATL
jgi:hypothetical protein